MNTKTKLVIAAVVLLAAAGMILSALLALNGTPAP